MSQLVIIGNPENRRVELFCDAATRLGAPKPRVIAYEAILAGEIDLAEAVPAGSAVRIESPGENAKVERELIAAGEQGMCRGSLSAACKDAPFAERTSMTDHGRIYYPRIWYAGFCRWLSKIEEQLAGRVSWMNHPGDIAVMFDKLRCQQKLRQHEIPVPELLGAVESYDDLRQRMRDWGMSRVFVKLLHGSSASGVVALQTSGTRVLATTSVEMVTRRDGKQPPGNPRGYGQSARDVELYNSLRIRKYAREREVARLIDALCTHGVYAEKWLPKAGWCRKTFDLRIVMIAGEVRHVVMRTSRGPLTNLHLGNARGNVTEFLAALPVAAREQAWETCRSVASALPRSLYFGIDLLFTPRFDKHAVLEINAFGDLLPNVLCDGLDTYAAELRMFDQTRPELQRGEPRSPS